MLRVLPKTRVVLSLDNCGGLAFGALMAAEGENQSQKLSDNLRNSAINQEKVDNPIIAAKCH